MSVPVTGAGRREVVSTAQRLSAWGLNVGTAGNVGLRADSGLLQIVTRRIRVDQRRERDGVENAFIAEQPSDGGIFRAGRGWRPKRGFEFPGYCILRSN